MGPFCLLWMGTLLLVCQATRYTNDWALRIRADPQSVDRIARKYGFTNMGQVGAGATPRRTELRRPSAQQLWTVVDQLGVNY